MCIDSFCSGIVILQSTVELPSKWTIVFLICTPYSAVKRHEHHLEPAKNQSTPWYAVTANPLHTEGKQHMPQLPILANGRLENPRASLTEEQGRALAWPLSCPKETTLTQHSKSKLQETLSLCQKRLPTAVWIQRFQDHSNSQSLLEELISPRAHPAVPVPARRMTGVKKPTASDWGFQHKCKRTWSKT